MSRVTFSYHRVFDMNHNLTLQDLHKPQGWCKSHLCYCSFHVTQWPNLATCMALDLTKHVLAPHPLLFAINEVRRVYGEGIEYCPDTTVDSERWPVGVYLPTWLTPVATSHLARQCVANTIKLRYQWDALRAPGTLPEYSGRRRW